MSFILCRLFWPFPRSFFCVFYGLVVVAPVIFDLIQSSKTWSSSVVLGEDKRRQKNKTTLIIFSLEKISSPHPGALFSNRGLPDRYGCVCFSSVPERLSRLLQCLAILLANHQPKESRKTHEPTHAKKNTQRCSSRWNVNSAGSTGTKMDLMNR